MSTYAELQKMVAGDKTPAEKTHDKVGTPQGSTTEKKKNGDVYRELSRMVQEGKTEVKYVPRAENPYLTKVLARDSAVLDPEVEAEAAERVYQEYLNSDEYRQKQNARTQERLRRLAMMDLTGIPEQYRPLMDYQEEDEKEVQLRKRAEELRAQADQKKQWETWENIDALVAEADAAYEAYIHSPEYAAWQLTQEKQAMDAIAQRGITQAPAGNPYGAAGQQVQLGSNANAVAEELKAKAEYYRNIQTQKQEQAQLDADMRLLAKWSPEDRKALLNYINSRQVEFYGQITDPSNAGLRMAWLEAEELKSRKGAQTVERMAESYTRYLNQKQAEATQAEAIEDANGGFLGATGASIGSVAANLLGSMSGFGGYAEEAAYRTGTYKSLDPNNMGMMPSVYAGAVRQQVGHNIEESGFGKAGATVYQAGMSALDNIARMVVGGGKLSLGLAAMGSFGQTVQQMSAQGANPVEATALGVINGGLEILTEKMSLDNILNAMENPKTGMEILKAALQAGAVEVSEEELSFIGSTLAEAMVLRERSGYQQQVAMLTAMGLPESLAREQASRGVIDEAVQTAVQSFLSGGFMSGGTTAYANVQNKIQSRRDGERLQETVQEAKAALEQKHDRDQVLPDTAAPAGQKPQQPAKTAPVRATPGGTVTIREGATVTREQLEQVERISSFTGRQIELYQAENENEEGWYDTNTGVLHIAASEKNPDARVIAHELTHSVETAPMYKELSSLVMTRIQKTGGNLEQLRQKKRDLYARNDITLENLDDIDREIVAGYVAEHLLTNEAEIMSLSTENPGIARKILNWLNDLLAKMGNANAQERTFIRKARDAYAKALEQTGAPLRDDAGKSVRQLKARKTATEEQHRKGEISDEDLDAFYDEYNREMEILGVDPMAVEDDRFRKRDEEDDRRYSFGGKEAQTANHKAREQAEDRERSGDDSEKIRQETGWFRGKDGKWRFEIDDSKMEIKDATSNYVRLGDLIEHDALFEAYPDLADVDVVFHNLDAGMNGSYNPQFDSIDLSRKLRNDPFGLKDALVHEIQHAVQKREGFSKGASPKYWEQKKKAGFDSRRAEDIQKARETEQELRRIQEEEPEFYRDMLELDAMTPDLPRGEIDWDTLEKIEDDPIEWQRYDARREELEEKYGDTRVWDMNDLLYRQEQAAKNMGRSSVELYYDTAGEIEARNASGRRSMDVEGRKKTPPILGGEDTVFAEQTGINFDQDYDEYPYNVQTVIREYIEATDETVKEFVEDVLDGKVWPGKKATVGTASEKMVSDIARIAGVEAPVGCNIFMNANAVRHIDNRHGAKGEHDDSMKDSRDLARINYILQNYDEMILGKRVSKEFKNRDGSRSKTVVVSKKINGTYFVVEAVPDTGKVNIVSAYMNKNGASQVLDAEAPSRNVRNELASTPDSRISDGSSKVNRKYSISDTNSNTGTAETVKSQAPAITRESLVGKARDNLKRAERQLHFEMSKAMNAPLFDKRERLTPFVENLTGIFMKDGTITEEKASEIFDRMIEESIDVSREFYRKYSGVYDQIRETDLEVGEDVRKEFPGFEDFRRRTDRYKTIRIVNSGGTSIADAYKQARAAAPELFPSNLTHPVDQLTRLFNVSQSIGSSGFNVENRDGDTWEVYKRTMKGNLFETLWEASEGLRTTRRYAQEREAEKAARENQKKEITVEEAGKLWEDLKTYRKAYQKISAKTLLTAHDEMQVGRLLRGEITLEHLANEENFDGIEAVYRAKAEYEKVNKQLKRYKAQVRAKRMADAESVLETANTWKDKKSGILYSRETMRRNLFDIVPDKAEAERVVMEYFEPVQISQADATRFKNRYRERVKSLGISSKAKKGDKVSEAYAVQLLGEAIDNMETIRKSRGRIKTRDGLGLEEWQGMIDTLWRENPNLDPGRIETAVKEFRKIYDELFKAMNQVRLENGYEPVNYRHGYFPHFQSQEGDGIIAYFGKTFGIDTSVEALPTTINGLTHTFKPGIQWFGHAQERKGFQTTYDALQGFDKYIEGVANVIYQTENIQKLRAFATQARYRTSDEGLRAQVDRVNANPDLSEEEKQVLIKEIFEKGKYSLSNFVVELDEYTNILAGKKSKYDRTMEALMGRKAYTVMKRIEGQVGANMIAGNFGSALTNFIPLTQAAARISPKYMLKGMKDTAMGAIRKDGFVVDFSDFLTNRRGSEALVRSGLEKFSGVLGKPMEIVDNAVSESIVRAAYYKNLAAGLSEAEAMHQADIFAAGVMADRSKGALPTVFESTNPLFKLFTQFQVEVNNQYSEVFKDLKREYAEQAKWRLTACLFQYFILAFAWNWLEEKIRGRESAMDPIGIAADFVQDWRRAGAAEAASNMVVNVVEDLPFVTIANLFGADLDGGRFAVASAIPDFSAISKAAKDKDMPGNKKRREIFEEIQKPITYLLMPAGGNQAAKTWKGVKAILDGGSYTLDGDGQEMLQYPIYKDFWEYARATVFGKSATKTGREWTKDGFDSFNAKQTALYEDLKEAGADEKTAYETIDMIRRVKKSETDDGAKVQREVRIRMIRDSKLSDACKDSLFYGMVAEEAERKLMDALADAGAVAGVSEFVAEFYEAKSRQGIYRKNGLRDVIQGAALTEAEKQIVVAEILGDDEVNEKGDLTTYGKFLYAKKFGLTANEYMDMYATGASLDKYIELREGEVTDNSAHKLAMALGALELSDLTSNEKWTKKVDAIMSSGVSETEKVTALVNVSYESTGRMIQIAYDNGISPDLCISLKRILPDFDENGNGRYTQAEVQNAIDAISGSEVYLAATGGKPKLTREQKAMLWQLSNKSWKYWKNPYDKDIGQYICTLMEEFGE